MATRRSQPQESRQSTRSAETEPRWQDVVVPDVVRREARKFLSIGREIQQLIETRLRELPEDAAKDFRELATLLGQETDELERAEIAKTISEFIFPESLRPGKPEDRAGDVRAARERVAGYRRQVGAAVKRQRLNLGLTQEALAQKAKLPQSHISRLEVGKHAPTFTTMQKLAKALDTTPSRLDPGFSD